MLKGVQMQEVTYKWKANNILRKKYPSEEVSIQGNQDVCQQLSEKTQDIEKSLFSVHL